MTAFAGFAFVVLSAVAAVLVGDAPGVSASATEVADYFDDEHSRVVTAAYLQGDFPDRRPHVRGRRVLGA